MWSTSATSPLYREVPLQPRRETPFAPACSRAREAFAAECVRKVLVRACEFLASLGFRPIPSDRESMSSLSRSHEKKLQLVYTLLQEDGCRSWEDGPAATLKLFSDATFEYLLKSGCAHLALDYAYPFLKRIELDGLTSPEFWQLHDGLVARALVDTKVLKSDDEAAACVLPKCLRKQPLFMHLFATLGTSQMADVMVVEVDELMGLLPAVVALAEARQNGASMDAKPLEGLEAYIERSEKAFEVSQAHRPSRRSPPDSPHATAPFKPAALPTAPSH